MKSETDPKRFKEALAARGLLQQWECGTQKNKMAASWPEVFYEQTGYPDPKTNFCLWLQFEEGEQEGFAAFLQRHIEHGYADLSWASVTIAQLKNGYYLANGTRVACWLNRFLQPVSDTSGTVEILNRKSSPIRRYQ